MAAVSRTDARVTFTVNHSLAYDRNGVLYLAFQASDPRFATTPRTDRPVRVFLAKSTDDGMGLAMLVVFASGRRRPG